MAQIAPVLLIDDIVNGVTNTQTYTGVAQFHISWKIGAPEDVSYSVGGEDFAKLTPGLPPAGTRVICPSLDGLGRDTRMLSTGTMIDNSLNPTLLSETGQGLAVVLTKKVIERLTAQQITITDVFTGQRGTVKPQAGGVVTPDGRIPTFQGIEQTARALWTTAIGNYIQFVWRLDSFTMANGQPFSQLYLDIDVNRDTPLRATQAVTDRLGSYIDPQRAQFVCDSGDFGVFYAEASTDQQARSVTVGHLGTDPVTAFQDMVDDDTPSPILEGSQFQPQTAQMLRSVRAKGGTTQHGVPFNGKLTDIVCINNRRNDATGDVQSGLPIVAIYGDRNHGGIFYAPGDNSLHAWSQAMGVNGLAYAESLSMLYAATDAGVYQHPSNINDTSLWQRLGAMALKVLKIVVVNQRLYALVDPANGAIPHVLQYTGTGTNAPAGQTGYGFDGWTSICAYDGLFDFGITFAYQGASVTMLYGLSTKAAGYVLAHPVEGGSLIGFGADRRLPIPALTSIGGAGITPVGTGLDVIAPYGNGSFDGGTPDGAYGVFVRTDSGSDGLYFISGAGTGMANVSPAHKSGVNLVDALATPVMVNHIAQHIPGILQWGFGTDPANHVTNYVTSNRTINLLAGTSRGVYVSPQLTGGWVWLRTDGQSNLGDLNIKRVTSAPPRAWLFDQIRCPIYGIDDDHLYVSYNGGINWVDVFANTLDAGPGFFHLWRKNFGNDIRYPNNDVAIMPYPDPVNGPYQLTRELDGLGQISYALVNPSSNAPAEGDVAQEISNIATASLVPEIQGSILVIDAMARVLAYNAAPQTILQIRSKFSEDDDVLRFLRPTQMVTVNGTVQQYVGGLNDNAPMTLVTYTNLVCFVLSHDIDFDATQDAVTAYTTTRLGTLCLDDRSSPDVVDSELFNMASRIQLYLTGGS